MGEQGTEQTVRALRDGLRSGCDAVETAAVRWIAELEKLKTLAGERTTVFGTSKLSEERMRALAEAIIGEEQAAGAVFLRISELLSVERRIAEAIMACAVQTVRDGGSAESATHATLSELQGRLAACGQEAIAPLRQTVGEFRERLQEQIDPRSGVCGSGRVAELCHGMILSVRHAVESLKRNLK